MTQSPRLNLPYLTSFQAQKDITHNEALAMIDALLMAVVQSRSIASPPTDPPAGLVWIVPMNAEDAWVGKQGQLAVATENGWRYAPPSEGFRAWLLDEAVEVRVIGGQWIGGDLRGASLSIGGQPVVGPRQAAVPRPSGGATVDSEARTAINLVIDSLISHGLISE